MDIEENNFDVNLIFRDIRLDKEFDNIDDDDLMYFKYFCKYDNYKDSKDYRQVYYWLISFFCSLDYILLKKKDNYIEGKIKTLIELLKQVNQHKKIIYGVYHVLERIVTGEKESLLEEYKELLFSYSIQFIVSSGSDQIRYEIDSEITSFLESYLNRYDDGIKIDDQQLKDNLMSQISKFLIEQSLLVFRKPDDHLKVWNAVNVFRVICSSYRKDEPSKFKKFYEPIKKVLFGLLNKAEKDIELYHFHSDITIAIIITTYSAKKETCGQDVIALVNYISTLPNFSTSNIFVDNYLRFLNSSIVCLGDDSSPLLTTIFSKFFSIINEEIKGEEISLQVLRLKKSAFGLLLNTVNRIDKFLSTKVLYQFSNLFYTESLKAIEQKQQQQQQQQNKKEEKVKSVNEIHATELIRCVIEIVNEQSPSLPLFKDALEKLIKSVQLDTKPLSINTKLVVINDIIQKEYIKEQNDRLVEIIINLLKSLFKSFAKIDQNEKEDEDEEMDEEDQDMENETDDEDDEDDDDDDYGEITVGNIYSELAETIKFSSEKLLNGNSDILIETFLPTIINYGKKTRKDKVKWSLLHCICEFVDHGSEKFFASKNFQLCMQQFVEVGFLNNINQQNDFYHPASYGIANSAKKCKPNTFKPYLSKSIDALISLIEIQGISDEDDDDIDELRTSLSSSIDNAVVALGNILIYQTPNFASGEPLSHRFPILLNTFVKNIPLVEDLEETKNALKICIHLLLNHTQITLYGSENNLSNILQTIVAAHQLGYEINQSEKDAIFKVFSENKQIVVKSTSSLSKQQLVTFKLIFKKTKK